MKQHELMTALEICTKNNFCKISLNTPVTDNYSNVYSLLIHESNASLIKSLLAADYSVAMTSKGLSVDKY